MIDTGRKSVPPRNLEPVPASWCPECWKAYGQPEGLCSGCGYDARGEVVLVDRGTTRAGLVLGIPLLALLCLGSAVGLVWTVSAVFDEGMAALCSGLFLLFMAYGSGMSVISMLRKISPRRRSVWRFRPDAICWHTGGTKQEWRAWPRSMAMRVSFGRGDSACSRSITLVVFPALSAAWADEADDDELPTGPVIHLRQTWSSLRNILIVGWWLEAVRASVEPTQPDEPGSHVQAPRPDDPLHRPPYCPACGYLLRGLPRPLRCPECGWTTQRSSEEAIVIAGWAGDSWSRHEAASPTRAGVFFGRAKEASFFLGCAAVFLGVLAAVGAVSRFVPPIMWQLAVGLVIALVLTAIPWAIFSRWAREDDAQPNSPADEQERKQPAAAQMDPYVRHTYLHLTAEGFLQSDGPTKTPLRPWSDATGWRVRPWFGAMRITAERLPISARLTGGRDRSEQRARPVDLVCELPRDLAPVLRERITRWRNLPTQAVS